MRAAALALAAVAGTACTKGSLQPNAADAGGARIDTPSTRPAATPARGRPRRAPAHLDRLSDVEDRGRDGSRWTSSSCSIGDPPSAGIGRRGPVMRDALTYTDRNGRQNDKLRLGAVRVSEARRRAVRRGDGAAQRRIMPCSPDDQRAVGRRHQSDDSSAFAGGTPTAAAIDVAVGLHAARYPTPSPKFLLLVTDGPPTCAGAGEQLTSADSAQAEADAMAAIATRRRREHRDHCLAPSTTAEETAAALECARGGGRHPAHGGRHKFDDETTFAELFVPSLRAVLRDPAARSAAGGTRLT